MKIVTAARCYNNVGFVDRFLRGYDFSDVILISDGGSTDGSIEKIEKAQKTNPKIKLVHFGQRETIDGETWNPDNPHMNFLLGKAKELEPTWIIMDDFDCVPNYLLRENARDFLEYSFAEQVNVFRLYLWGEDQYFPYMNRSFDLNYVSLWAWQPKLVDVRADETVHHLTMIGLYPEPLKIDKPFCLLHKSWNPKTIDKKVERYNKLGIAMGHPYTFAGQPEPLPDWAKE